MPRVAMYIYKKRDSDAVVTGRRKWRRVCDYATLGEAREARVSDARASMRAESATVGEALDNRAIFYKGKKVTT